MYRIINASLLALVTSLSAPAQALDFPTKPMRIVVPYGAGGGIDFTARTVANGLSQRLDESIIVENRPGANSALGAQAVASSAPDGHTLLFTSGATVSVLPHMSQSLPFDPQKDLIPVSLVAKMPFFLVVHPDTPAKDLPEFLAYAKSKPGVVTYASGGNGTGAHLGFELLKQAAGINVTHVPYKTTAQALPDLRTGRVTAMMADLPVVKRLLADNSVRALAVSTKNRSSVLPDIPTMAEQGVTDFDLELWMALFAPAGTPSDVISKINTELKVFLESPEAAAAFDTVSYTVAPSTPETLAELVSADSQRWEALARSGALAPN